MELLWSGGEASPPIPLHDLRKKRNGTPKHALLFPGSGSQYVGMGHFLKGYDGARQVWREAEDALESFEDWASSLELESREGELGELGKMFSQRRKERMEETKLQSVVFDGPQVRSVRALQRIQLLTLVPYAHRKPSHGRPTPNPQS